MTATIEMRSVDGDVAWARVSPEGAMVRLVFSIEGDGDIDAIVTPAGATALAEVLQEACVEATRAQVDQEVHRGDA